MKNVLKCASRDHPSVYFLSLLKSPSYGSKEVMWNQPFKQSLHDAYDLWMAGDADKECTAGVNLRASAHHLLMDWVGAALEKLDKEIIRKSFKLCGLSLKTDGSEDDFILCFREGQPCAAGRDALTQLWQQGQEENNKKRRMRQTRLSCLIINLLFLMMTMMGRRVLRETPNSCRKKKANSYRKDTVKILTFHYSGKLFYR